MIVRINGEVKKCRDMVEGTVSVDFEDNFIKKSGGKVR